MTECRRPLDPIDADALAAGAEPVFAADAAAHAAGCAACGARLEAARGFLEALDRLPGPADGLPALAERVTRLRAFSPRERRTYALWNAPVLLTAGFAGTGTALLSLPALTAGDQVSIGIAASAPLLGLLRSLGRSAVDLLALAPRGLEALSQGMRQEGSLGLVALALLLPVGFALSRVLARAAARR